MITFIIFIIVLSALVFVHELGHFLAARIFKIRVDEFAIGFPPRIWAKKWGKTTYAINSVPIGGYVKIYGENPEDSQTPDNILSKPRWQQSIVLLAGITFNVIFAWLLLSFSLMLGTKTSTDGFPPSAIHQQSIVVDYIMPGSPADQAGLVAGDELLTVANSDDVLATTSITVANVQSLIEKSGSVTISYQRNSDPVKVVTITPVSGLVPNEQAIGISMTQVGIVKVGFFKSLWYGLEQTYYLTINVVSGLFDFFKNIFIGHADFNQVSGPVGIATVVGQASRIGFASLITIVAIISVNLAVINLLPLPALDGGRVVVVIIEAIRRKPLNTKIINTINIIGFCLLILLMVIVTFKDLYNLIHP